MKAIRSYIYCAVVNCMHISLFTMKSKHIFNVDKKNFNFNFNYLKVIKYSFWKMENLNLKFKKLQEIYILKLFLPCAVSIFYDNFLQKICWQKVKAIFERGLDFLCVYCVVLEPGPPESMQGGLQ